MRVFANNCRRALVRAALLSTVIIASAVVVTADSRMALAVDKQEASTAVWNELKPELFSNRAIKLETGAIHIGAPKRAQDPGLVPIDLEIDPGKAGGEISTITLVIDVNPSPVVAVIKIGKNSGLRKISTRVRVNDYSYVRAIAETTAGELHMAETFVKATGGCGAPSMKNQDEAKATMGVMKLRQFPPQQEASNSARREVQLMIRHPNNSGFQMDQLTHYYIPAHFVNSLKVSRNGEMILQMEGGISISEDPNFRFDFVAPAGGEIEAEAIDTAGTTFRDKWPVDAAGI
jgi:sulfur-oxidizing protein SoxY